MERSDLKYLIDTFSEIIRSVHLCSYQQMDHVKLYPGQPKLLAVIYDHEGLTQKELADKNCVKPASITGMLNKLEANGYVYRVPDEADRRNLRVYLTPEGRDAALLGKRFLIGLAEKMFTDFTEEEIKSFIELTHKIKSNLQ